MPYEIVQGSNGNVLELVIRDDGKIVNLTGTSVSVVVTYKSTGVIKQATITDPINGICELTLSSQDIQFEGVYSFQATVTYSDSRKFTSTIQRFSVLKKIGFIPNTGEGVSAELKRLGISVNGKLTIDGVEQTIDNATSPIDGGTFTTTYTTDIVDGGEF